MTTTKAESLQLLWDIEKLLGGGRGIANLRRVLELLQSAWDVESVGIVMSEGMIVIGDQEKMSRVLDPNPDGLPLEMQNREIPIMGNGKQLGILQLVGLAGTPEVILMNLVAQQIGNAMDNADTLLLMERQSTELTWLNTFSDSLVELLGTLQIDEVVAHIMSAVKDMLNVEQGSIFLRETESDELILWHYTPPEKDLSVRLKPGQGLAGWVLESGEPAMVNDVHEDVRWESEIDRETDFRTRSLLAMPIRLDDTIVGVVEAVNKIDGAFTEGDALRLSTLAKWAAIAIGNANTFDELKRTHERLSDTKKQAAMAQMVLNLAHKINNSVGAIRVWAMEAYNEVDNETYDVYEFKALLGNIMANVGETLLMVRRIRSATEVTPEDFEPVHMSEVLDDAVRASRIHSGIEIETQYQDDISAVAAEHERLVEVFLNLVNNAVDALGAQGKITLSLQQTQSGEVEARVQDNGDGIPEHIQATIFDPFVTSKTDGLGLGLWMVKLYIELINGSITMNTSPGKGTMFRVILPNWGGN